MPRACGKAEFVAAVTRSDPFGRALRTPLDPELLDLAWQLLKWEPTERLSAADALRHPALAPTPAPTPAGAGAWWASPLRSIRNLLLSPPDAPRHEQPVRGADADAVEGATPQHAAADQCHV